MRDGCLSPSSWAFGEIAVSLDIRSEKVVPAGVPEFVTVSLKECLHAEQITELLQSAAGREKSEEFALAFSAPEKALRSLSPYR